MKITHVQNTQLHTHRNINFGKYKLAKEWQPFITEIQNAAAKKCVSNMDGPFYRQLTFDLKELNEGKINFSEFISEVRNRIINGTNYNEKAMEKFNELTAEMSSKLNSLPDTDVLVSKPYWGETRLEKVAGQTYPESVTDSLIDLTIPNTDFKCTMRLGSQRRFFFSGMLDDDFQYARETWGNIEGSDKTPFRRMLGDFQEALVKGFEDMYNGIIKTDEIPQNVTNKGSGSIPPFINDKQFNNEFRFCTFN